MGEKQCKMLFLRDWALNKKGSVWGYLSKIAKRYFNCEQRSILCDLYWIYYENNKKENLLEADNYLKYNSWPIKVVVLWI